MWGNDKLNRRKMTTLSNVTTLIKIMIQLFVVVHISIYKIVIVRITTGRYIEYHVWVVRKSFKTYERFGFIRILASIMWMMWFFRSELKTMVNAQSSWKDRLVRLTNRIIKTMEFLRKSSRVRKQQNSGDRGLKKLNTGKTFGSDLKSICWTC